MTRNNNSKSQINRNKNNYIKKGDDLKKTYQKNKEKIELSEKVEIIPKKENLYNFLREMEFNRLLSQAISFYGEETNNKNNLSTKSINKKIKT